MFSEVFIGYPGNEWFHLFLDFGKSFLKRGMLGNNANSPIDLKVWDLLISLSISFAKSDCDFPIPSSYGKGMIGRIMAFQRWPHPKFPKPLLPSMARDFADMTNDFEIRRLFWITQVGPM